MAYCTLNDLNARGWGDEIAGLSDKAGELGGDVNTAILNQAIADASAKIDSYLVGLIQTPIENPSDIVIRYACDITRFYLYDIGVNEPIRKAYEEAIAFFERVHQQKTALVSLLGAVELEAMPNMGEQKPVVIAPTPFFTESLLAKM